MEDKLHLGTVPIVNNYIIALTTIDRAVSGSGTFTVFKFILVGS